MRLDIIRDERSPQQRAEALDGARQDPELDVILLEAVVALEAARDGAGSPDDVFWGHLDDAFAAIDRYLAHLVKLSALRPTCSAGCSACCADLPPATPVEGLRMLRALAGASDGANRIQRSVEAARKFQGVLQRAIGDAKTANTGDSAYLRAQMAWRTHGYPCPMVDDHGSCSEYEARPLACRIHISVENPAHCSPNDPSFLDRETPSLWTGEGPTRVTRLLAEIGERLQLPGTPNLPWAVALLHEHPLARP